MVAPEQGVVEGAPVVSIGVGLWEELGLLREPGGDAAPYDLETKEPF